MKDMDAITKILAEGLRSVIVAPPLSDEEAGQQIVRQLDASLIPHGGFASFVRVLDGEVHYSIALPPALIHLVL